MTTFDWAVILGVLLVVLIGWICYVIIQKDRGDPMVTAWKEECMQDGVLNREQLANVVHEAIVLGTWTP
jgi:hypothetical protein